MQRSVAMWAVILGVTLGAAPARAQAADARLAAYDAITGEPVSNQATPEQDAAMRAFDTETPAIAPTPADKRAAAVAYMNDALALIDQARAHLRDANVQPRAHAAAMAELMGASAKASIAYLLMFHDNDASARLRPMALALRDAERLAAADPATALAMLARTQPRLASIYQTELATMGGGAGH